MSHLASTEKVAVITGAGSGVGRAIALKFAEEGWRVGLVGRRSSTLEETVGLATAAAQARFVSFPCDLSEPGAVDTMVAGILSRFDCVDVLVNAAGTNIPRRSLGELSRKDYMAVMAANIDGVLHTVQAFLPRMRQHGNGLIINIGSEAGRLASAKAGAAYVISKFGLTGLTQAINAEERQNGIRACCIFPGDIDTAILEKRPVPPSPEMRARMLLAEDVAACAWFVAGLPPRATVEELVIRPARPFLL